MERQTMLKLVISNSDLISKDSLFKQVEKIDYNLEASPIGTLLFDCMKIASSLYIFRARDFDHNLVCEMSLELTEDFAVSRDDIEEEKYFNPIMTCNFASIDVSRFNEKICWDAYLQGIIMVQFQLKILEKLLLFCEEKDVAQLVLTISNVNYDNLEIYRHFSFTKEQVIDVGEDQTKIIIPTDPQSYDEVIELMDKVDEDFRQTLWRNQKANPTFRKYLMDHSLLVS